MRMLLALAAASLALSAGCKARREASGVNEYQAYASPRGELRLNWYTNRERNFDPGASESEFTARVSALFPDKGVISVPTPDSYRYGDPVLRDPPLGADDGRYNQELVYGAYDDLYAQRATIFIHGYNNTAEAAFERAAQLFTALGTAATDRETPFRSKSFAFSWPSLGRAVDDLDVVAWIRTGQPFYMRTYSRDESAAAASLQPLTDFLWPVCNPESRYRQVNVVAHSLGTRLASEALASISRYYQDQMTRGMPGIDPRTMASRMPCRIHHLVLASGDMGLFRFRQILPDLLLIVDKITLYENATLIDQALHTGVTADIPLALSKLLHFFSRFELGPRIGQASIFTELLDQRVDVVVMKMLDVDVGAGHNDVFESATVLRDLTFMLNDQPSPFRRTQQSFARNFYQLR